MQTAPIATISSTPTRDRRTWFVVVTTWFVCTLTGFWFVSRFATDIPYGDDYELVPVITGQQPLSLTWLWAPHNEHRIFLPRLVLCGLSWLTGHYAAGMSATVAMLSAAALISIFTAARLRGRPALTDIFLPLLWLHWGQAENLLWSFQIGFSLPGLLTCLALALIVSSPGRGWGWSHLGLVGLLTAFPLCGGNGLLTSAPLLVWLWSVAAMDYVRSRRNGTDHRAANRNEPNRSEPVSSERGTQPATRVLTALVVAGLVIATAIHVLYFIGLSSPAPAAAEPPSLSQRGQAALRFLGIAWGPYFRPQWPVAGPLTLLILIYALVSIAALLRNQPEHRRRTSGLLVLLISPILFTVAVSLSRSDLHAGAIRYTTLWLPGLTTCYLIAVACGRRGGASFSTTLAPWALAGGAVVLRLNAWWGWDYGQRFSARRAAFVAGINARIPSAVLAQLFHRRPFPLYFPSADILNERFHMLHQAEFPPFDALQLSNRTTIQRVHPHHLPRLRTESIQLPQPAQIAVIEITVQSPGTKVATLNLMATASLSRSEKPHQSVAADVFTVRAGDSSTHYLVVNGQIDSFALISDPPLADFEVKQLIFYTDE